MRCELQMNLLQILTILNLLVTINFANTKFITDNISGKIGIIDSLNKNIGLPDPEL